MTGLIPLYLKTTYKKDPIFKDSKSIFSVYNNSMELNFEGDLTKKVKMLDIDDSMLGHLDTLSYEGFIKIGIQYADLVIQAEGELNEGLINIFKTTEAINKQQINMLDDNVTETHFNIYHELLA
jgi:starch synthase